VEHLAFRIPSTGNYTLTVYRREEGGGKNESFAVAARVLASASVAPSIGTSATYGVSRSAGGVMRSIDFDPSVPEPSALIGVAAVVALLSCGRRRRAR
jgi:hypothetical protein